MTHPRLLAIFAHPDDESMMAGGTLAACGALGAEVRLLSMTHGELGPIADGKTTRRALGGMRAGELQEAGRALGVRETQCLDYPDGTLRSVDARAAASDLSDRILVWRPDVVITFGPEGLYWHKDHMAVHRFVVEAIRQVVRVGANPWLYFATWPAGMTTELVHEMEVRELAADLWGLSPGDFGAPAETITTKVDVRRFLGRKVQALRSHRTQLPADHLFTNLPGDLAERFLGWEYFVRAHPRETDRDLLRDLVSGTIKVSAGA
jgi:LmbE family N-acetylglucosaminyl deacetylase